MKNQIQLIAYVDRLAGDLKRMRALLRGPLQGIFGGVHLLPFFVPIDGADAGFDPVDHTQVDPRLGDWDDVRALGEEVEVMADLIVNHISSDSPQFKDFSRNGAKSPFADMFLTYERVFPLGAREHDLTQIYRPRPGLPFTSSQKKLLWTTFTPQQVDIDEIHLTGQKLSLLAVEELAPLVPWSLVRGTENFDRGNEPSSSFGTDVDLYERLAKLIMQDLDHDGTHRGASRNGQGTGRLGLALGLCSGTKQMHIGTN